MGFYLFPLFTVMLVNNVLRSRKKITKYVQPFEQKSSTRTFTNSENKYLICCNKFIIFLHFLFMMLRKNGKYIS